MVANKEDGEDTCTGGNAICWHQLIDQYHAWKLNCQAFPIDGYFFDIVSALDSYLLLVCQVLYDNVSHEVAVGISIQRQ